MAKRYVDIGILTPKQWVLYYHIKMGKPVAGKTMKQIKKEYEDWLNYTGLPDEGLDVYFNFIDVEELKKWV